MHETGVLISSTTSLQVYSCFQLHLPYVLQLIWPQYFFWHAPSRLDNFQDISAHILWQPCS